MRLFGAGLSVCCVCVVVGVYTCVYLFLLYGVSVSGHALFAMCACFGAVCLLFLCRHSFIYMCVVAVAV